MNIDLKERNASMKWFFDMKAEGFDDVHMALIQSKKAITPVLSEDTKRVLDLGVGTGMELYDLTERFPDVKITGIDISPEMLKYIEKRPFAKQVECIVGDFFTVDFGKGYDAVISTSALHHFAPEDKKRLFAKIFDSLKQGGKFVNSDVFARDEAHMMECYNNFLTNTERPHIDTPLYPELEMKLLREVGFADISCTKLEEEKYSLMVCTKP